MGTGTKIKLEFRTRSAGLVVVEEIVGDDKIKSEIIKDLSASFGMNKFPTSKFELNATSKNPNLISIKSGDEVALYMAEGDTLHKMFYGELLSVKVKSDADTFKLQVEAVSVFHKLQRTKLNFAQFENTHGLREILNEVIRICNINGRVVVDDSEGNDFTLGQIRGFLALSFINAICFEKDLVYQFNEGDVMTLSRRKDIIHKMDTVTPITFDPDQFISSSFQQ